LSGPAPLMAPGLWRRMACWLYEGMLLFGVVFVSGWLFSTLGQVKEAQGGSRWLLQGFLFVVFGVYFGWLWNKGQTLAMKTWHIRIVDRHGQPVSQPRAFVRYLLSWVWVLPPLAAVSLWGLSTRDALVLVPGWVAVWAVLSRFHPERQFWHDALAGTRLIPARPA